jgi:hypothetical protein
LLSDVSFRSSSATRSDKPVTSRDSSLTRADSARSSIFTRSSAFTARSASSRPRRSAVETSASAGSTFARQRLGALADDVEHALGFTPHDGFRALARIDDHRRQLRPAGARLGELTASSRTTLDEALTFGLQALHERPHFLQRQTSRSSLWVAMAVSSLCSLAMLYCTAS